MIGLDTNALIRLLTQDDPAQAARVAQRLEPFDTVPESVLLNNIVLVETLWTLRRVYGFDRKAMQDLLAQLLSAQTFRFENREVTSKAAALFSSTAADFSDCLIAVQNAHMGCDLTLSFDKAMAKLPQVVVLAS